MEALVAAISSISISSVLTVPPEVCFAKFRWDDCGFKPQPVMYYWQPGSRCEVGIWRGCLPNYNMFKDEYECVSTCIFNVRAHASDFHIFNAESNEFEETTILSEGTEFDSDEENGNSTDVGTGGTTVADGTGAGDDAVTKADGDGEVTKADGDGDATTPAAEAEGDGDAEPPPEEEGRRKV